MKIKSRYLLLATMAIFSFSAMAQKSPLTLENLFQKREFAAQSVYGVNSMNDGEHYTTLEGRAAYVVRHKYKTGETVDTLFSIDGEYIKQLNAKLDKDAQVRALDGYELSADETKIVVEANSEPIFRRSSKSDFYVFDIKTKTLTPVSANGKQQNSTLSPDGSKIAFVRTNNLYMVDLATGVEEQITTDGVYGKIINGVTDWCYEEEFGFSQAFAWSPDSRRIAFYRFDESEVPQFNMTMYEGRLYPFNYTFKYPKAGEKNSIVSIHVFTLEGKKTVKMDVGPETDQYIGRIKWLPNSQQLAMMRLNRLQNQLDIILANPESGASNTILTEKNNRYVEEVTDSYLTFTPDSKEFIIPSERSGFRHIYHFDITGKLLHQVTAGSWDITSIQGFDAKNRIVYYQSAEESPLRRAVYAINLDGTKKKRLSEFSGSNTTAFSTGCKYYINYYSSTKSPVLVTLHAANGKLLRTLKDNQELKSKLAGYDLPTKEFFSFTTSEGVVLNGYMVKPANFDAATRYPVLMTQYSGPNSQEVLDRWGLGWDEYLASQGVIVACIDSRGTGARGEEFRKMTYGQMGKYETMDQIEGAKYLQTLAYVDPARIGIWGWSYGGFMSMSALMKGNDVFKMAIAVAPVTNWRFYDSIYTERFMGLPKDNAAGYDENSPINYVDKLKGKLLIVHGSADDNVHMQNSMEIINKLIAANKQFDMMIYPDRNHSIYARYHLYTKLTDYVKANL